MPFRPPYNNSTHQPTSGHTDTYPRVTRFQLLTTIISSSILHWGIHLHTPIPLYTASWVFKISIPSYPKHPFVCTSNMKPSFNLAKPQAEIVRPIRFAHLGSQATGHLVSLRVSQLHSKAAICPQGARARTVQLSRWGTAVLVQHNPPFASHPLFLLSYPTSGVHDLQINPQACQPQSSFSGLGQLASLLSVPHLQHLGG